MCRNTIKIYTLILYTKILLNSFICFSVGYLTHFVYKIMSSADRDCFAYFFSIWIYFVLFYFLFSLNDMFIDFRGRRWGQRERKRDRETWVWERNINKLLSLCAPWGIEFITQVCSLTRNQTCNLFGERDDAPINWATWPGLFHFLIKFSHREPPVSTLLTRSKKIDFLVLFLIFEKNIVFHR